VTWEWQAWRCFDHITEALEDKGWESGFAGGNGNGMMPPLLAESHGHGIAFFERDSGTGECWFELRDKARNRVVFVRGTQNIPVPEEAARMLADYGWPLDGVSSARALPLYSLPVAPTTVSG
jgi:hypothetical protein